MNPQMQNYRQYPPAQARAPAARRPGECASSTASYPRNPNYRLPSVPMRIYPHGVIPNFRSTRYTPLLHPNTQVANGQRHPLVQSVPMHVREGHVQPRRVLRYVHTQPPPPQPVFALHRTPTHGVPVYLQGYVKPGPPHPNPQQQFAAQQAQIQNQQAQHRHAMIEHQQAQRRAKKPTDRNMPDGIEDLVIGDAVQQYRDLREAEKRLDYAMMRKRMDLQDAFSRTAKRQKTLRLFISNTAENQPWQGDGLDENTFDFSNGGEGTYRVKIEGRLLDDPDDNIFDSDDEDEATAGAAKEDATSSIPAEKMSHFFKSMNVEFDKSKTHLNEQGVTAEWKKQSGSPDVDEITFSRRGDENQNIALNFVRDEQPERFRLSHALSQTLDMEEGDRAEVVMGIWEYVKAMGLQEDEEKRSIRCDESLRQIFGRDHIYFPQIPDQIMQHLHPLPPLKLPYTIRVDEAYISDPEPMIFDITVYVKDPMRHKIDSFLSNPEHITNLRSIHRADDELAVVIQAIAHSKSKHAFYRNFNKDPAGFIKKWLASQRRDLEVILGEAGRGGGEDGSGIEFARGGEDGVWGSDIVREAARYLLARPQAGKV